jgi:hypothetical protein
MMFLDCPAYLDEDGTQRCCLPAEVTARFAMGSTSGPIENVKICCPSGHRFHGPVEFLTVPADQRTKQPPRRSAVAPMTPGAATR